eukprot:TRINITY_DN4519_c0_g1_i1.p1 TRINITY_DN4519_c0_g1~~TRINITY_DN4519_c0_g1_i1.p1  ORF type:complete len:240 (-),score=20.43 TRINITY_DN4519_c0_g1_i1:168-887(-)
MQFIYFTIGKKQPYNYQSRKTIDTSLLALAKEVQDDNQEQDTLVRHSKTIRITHAKLPSLNLFNKQIKKKIVDQHQDSIFSPISPQSPTSLVISASPQSDQQFQKKRKTIKLQIQNQFSLKKQDFLFSQTKKPQLHNYRSGSQLLIRNSSLTRSMSRHGSQSPSFPLNKTNYNKLELSANRTLYKPFQIEPSTKQHQKKQWSFIQKLSTCTNFKGVNNNNYKDFKILPLICSSNVLKKM